MSGIAEPDAPLPVEGYYRWQSKIYDATRWSFLFGRSRVLRAAAAVARPGRILEIGCGTGRNLAELARLFPTAHLTGLDVSADMLALARKKLAAEAARVELLRQPYHQPLTQAREGEAASVAPFDLILCSYSLSMFNPGWEQAIDSACADLAPDGVLALVDFHDSRHTWFRRWMAMNHVRMEGHLLPRLRTRLAPLMERTHPAYGGLWEWALFAGRSRL